MTDPTTQFFEELRQRGHEPLLQKVSGTVRFDLAQGKQTDRWLVSAEKGDIAVSHKGGNADLVISTDRALFDRLARGEMNLIAAVLRGEVAIEGGAWRIMVLISRLFPGPQSARDVRRAAGYARRSS